MMPLLAPIFQGEWAAHGEALHCAEQHPDDTVLLADLLHRPDLLADVLGRQARLLRVTGQDWRAVASAWSLSYLWALLPPVVAAASLLRHRFDIGIDQVAVRFDTHGSATSFHIRHEGHPLPGSDTETRYASLLRDHLDPLFAAVHRHTRLAPKILWGNAARYLELILDQALEMAGPQPELVEDRATLLDREFWAGGRANPMHAGRRRLIIQREDGPVALHRQCCLFYLLPGEGYCGACPLDPRHGRPGPS